MNIKTCNFRRHKNPNKKVYCEKYGNKLYDAFISYFSHVKSKDGQQYKI